MHKMSNLEYSFIVNELSPKIVGKHFGRIRKLGDNVYRMKIGSTEIICELGVRIHETRYIEKSELTDKFTEKVDKELDNSRLLEIVQVNNDRIVAFLFDKGKLVFEMFGDGNAIFVRDGITQCAHTYESWAEREIKPGSAYSPPKNIPSEKLELNEKYVIVSLMKLPLGKDYAIEALARAGIDEKRPGNELSGNEILKLETDIKTLKGGAKPVAFMKDGKTADFALASLSKYSALESKEYPSLSEAADEYYTHLEKENPRLEKLLSRLEKQKERMLILKEEELGNRAKGDFIYGHFMEAQNAISSAREGRFDPAWKTDKKEKSIDLDLQ